MTIFSPNIEMGGVDVKEELAFIIYTFKWKL
jgi:hypothetical protein